MYFFKSLRRLGAWTQFKSHFFQLWGRASACFAHTWSLAFGEAITWLSVACAPVHSEYQKRDVHQVVQWRMIEYLFIYLSPLSLALVASCSQVPPKRETVVIRPREGCQALGSAGSATDLPCNLTPVISSLCSHVATRGIFTPEGCYDLSRFAKRLEASG